MRIALECLARGNVAALDGKAAVIIKLCVEWNQPIIPRWAGTSLSGAAMAVERGVRVGLSRMNRGPGGLSKPAGGCVNATDVINGRGLLYARSGQPAGMYDRRECSDELGRAKPLK
jgi:hypothetical protein